MGASRERSRAAAGDGGALTMLHDRVADAERTEVRGARAAWRASPPVVRGVTLGLAGLALLAALHPSVPLAAGCAVAVLLPAALVDLHSSRLPDGLVAAGATVLLLAAAAGTLSGATVDLAGPAGGAAAMAGPMLLLHLWSPRRMGFGDVKLGVVLGAALGAVDWELALAGLALGAGISAVFGFVRNAAAVPLGPGLVAAAAIALAAHPLLLPEPAERPTDVHCVAQEACP